jgi:hypothetical protein
VPVLVQEDVVGLDVAMDHTPLVGVGQAGADLVTEPGELRTWQPTPLVYEPFEVPARDVLHDDVGGIPAVEFGFSRVVDLYDVRVRQAGRGTSLTLEAVAYIRAAVERVEQLYGDGAIQYLITPEKDTGHASRA